MMYAATKDFFKGFLDGVGAELQVCAGWRAAGLVGRLVMSVCAAVGGRDGVAFVQPSHPCLPSPLQTQTIKFKSNPNFKFKSPCRRATMTRSPRTSCARAW